MEDYVISYLGTLISRVSEASCGMTYLRILSADLGRDYDQAKKLFFVKEGTMTKQRNTFASYSVKGGTMTKQILSKPTCDTTG